MEKSSKPIKTKLDLHIPGPEPRLPFNLKAKLLSFSRGIPYNQAYQEVLDAEIQEHRKERERSHAP